MISYDNMELNIKLSIYSIIIYSINICYVEIQSLQIDYLKENIPNKQWLSINHPHSKNSVLR